MWGYLRRPEEGVGFSGVLVTRNLEQTDLGAGAEGILQEQEEFVTAESSVQPQDRVQYKE